MRSISISIICIFCITNLFGQANNANLTITQLQGHFYIYESYNTWKGNRIGANAMYLVTDSGVVLFDTPWDSTQFLPLLDSIQARHNKKVMLCIATHFHEDRTGGLAFYSSRNIKTYTTAYTDELSKSKGMKRAKFTIEKDTTFTVGQYSFQTFYPGKGHAPDNIVIWFVKQKILYGGCLIKSVDDTTLGNLSDASVTDYATTVKKVMDKYKAPAFVITGHGNYENTNSLKHTFKMAKKLSKQKK